MIPPLLLFHEACLEHDTGAHPESKERLLKILEALKKEGLDPFLKLSSCKATREDILEVHREALYEAVAATASQPHAFLDSDTVTSPRSFEAALAAAGMVLEGVDKILQKEHKIVFAFPRPPGHHATRNRPMGFCLFNNIALAATKAKKSGLKKIFILDWDVHHGNGTQDIFSHDPSVFFLSIHQYPLYPGTGWVTEEGAGQIFNAPLPPGAGEGDYMMVLEEICLPLLEKMQPELILVSAGYDAHCQDPLGGMKLQSKSFEKLAHYLPSFLDKGCQGIFLTLEGGYHLQALALSVLYTLKGLTELPLSLQDPYSLIVSKVSLQTKEVIKTLKRRIIG